MKSSTSKMKAILAAAIFSTSGIALANEVSPTGNKASSVAEGRPPVSGISSGISPVPSATLSEAVTAPDIIRKVMKVSGYQLVKVSGNFKVYLQEGDEQKIVVEADENLVPEVKHFIVDNTLNIYTSDQVKKRITLWVTLKDVNNLNKFGKVRVIRK